MGQGDEAKSDIDSINRFGCLGWPAMFFHGLSRQQDMTLWCFTIKVVRIEQVNPNGFLFWYKIRDF